MNIHTKKKNCTRCKAYHKTEVPYCELNYEIENRSFDPHGFTMFGVPLENCPKPITYADFLFASKFYTKNNVKRLHHTDKSKETTVT